RGRWLVLLSSITVSLAGLLAALTPDTKYREVLATGAVFASIATLIFVLWTRPFSRKRRRLLGVSFSTVWSLAGLMFSQKMRREVYDPVIEELKEDLLSAKAMCRTPTARFWVRCCFIFRTVAVLGACCRISCGRVLARLVPCLIRLWSSFR